MITRPARTLLAGGCLALLLACGGGGGGGGASGSGLPALSAAGDSSGTLAGSATPPSGSAGDVGGPGVSAGGSGNAADGTSTAAAEGTGGVGSGGTGATADAVGIGSVDGLGSVILDGLRYNTDAAQFHVEDATQIELGMSAKITGPVGSDFTSGAALRVESAADLRGTVSGIDTVAGTFQLMGTTVSSDPATVWADSSGLPAIASGATLQVWGLPGAPGTLRATRVAQVAPAAAIVTGTVDNLNPSLRTFTLGALAVNYAGATFLSGLDAPALANGMLVRVRAGAPAAGTPVAAVSIQRWYPAPQAGTVAAQLTGIVSSYAGLQRFLLLGNWVDASTAQVTGGPAAAIGNGVKVEVVGTLSGGVLRAVRLKIRHVPGTGGPSSFDLAGTVGAFASPASFRVRGQPVDASAPGTVFVNGSPADLRNGAKVAVSGSQVRNGVLLAERVAFD